VTANEDREPATPRDLWDAADRLTQPGSTRLVRDDGHTERHPLPSLFAQLVDAMESGAGQKTGSAFGSKPPLDAAALSLLIEIAEHVRDGCLDRGIKRRHDTPLDLRQLVSAINTEGDGQRIDRCARLVQSWCARIVATIASDPDRTWRMHNAACRVCSSTSVPVFGDDGSETRQPALIVHSADGRIDSIVCGFCGSVLTGPDLTAILLDTRRNTDKMTA
jgi:hypothetical protein